MNTNIPAAGAVPIVSVLDYLGPEINRPDLFYEQAYPVRPVGSGSARALIKMNNIKNKENANQSIQRHTAAGQERSPLISIYYTTGLIIFSAAIFLTLAAWSNVLLSWYDSMYVNPVVSSVTKSRLYFAITLTIISIIIIAVLILLWYYFTIHRQV